MPSAIPVGVIAAARPAGGGGGGVSLPYSEAFTGTNGAAWPSPWVITGTTGFGSSIQSNAGQLTLGTAGSYTDGTCALLGDVGASDFTITYDVTMTANEHYPTCAFRTDGTWASRYQATNGFHVELGGNSNWAQLYRMSGGVRTDLTAQVVIGTYGTSVVHVKIYAKGGILKARIWIGAASEPTTWQLEAFDEAHNARQHFGFTVSGGSTGTSGPVDFDTVSITGSPANIPTRIQEVGRNTVQSAGTTLSVSFSGSIKPQSGDWIFIRCARDNIVNDPATGDSITTTPGGESYTSNARAQPSGTSSAGLGLVGVFFYAQVSSAWAAGTNTITWTSPSVTARAFIVEHWRGISGIRSGTNNNAASSVSTPSTGTGGSLSTGDLAYASAMIENGGNSFTADSDTSNGSWSTPVTLAETGTTGNATTRLTYVAVTGQYKVVSGAGTQTYNPTYSVSTDMVLTIQGFAP